MEKTIRKKWLISFFVITSATCLFAIFPNTTLLAKMFTLFGAVSGGITYYYGYKKRGTSWLSWIIAIRSLSILITLVQISYYVFTKQLLSFMENLSTSLSLSLNTSMALWIGGIVASIYYTYWCYQLKKINSQQKQRLTSEAIKKVI